MRRAELFNVLVRVESSCVPTSGHRGRKGGVLPLRKTDLPRTPLLKSWTKRPALVRHGRVGGIWMLAVTFDNSFGVQPLRSAAGLPPPPLTGDGRGGVFRFGPRSCLEKTTLRRSGVEDSATRNRPRVSLLNPGPTDWEGPALKVRGGAHPPILHGY